MPLMYLYNGGESSFITTRDSLEYSRRCFRLTLACCYATHATISRTNGGGGGRACFPRARRFSLSFKSRRSNHEARKIIRVRTSATRGWNTARKKKAREEREKRELKSSLKMSGCDQRRKFREWFYGLSHFVWCIKRDLSLLNLTKFTTGSAEIWFEKKKILNCLYV